MRRLFLRSFPVILILANFSCGNFDFADTSQPPPPPVVPSIYDWTQQETNTESNLFGIFFHDGNYGCAVGESQTILVTSNSGQSWPEAPSSAVDSDLKSIYFVDNQTGWISGGKDENSSSGHVFISTQGGAYPTAQRTVSVPLNAVFFLNQNIGWAGGDDNTLLKTEDGGSNWDVSSVAADRTINSLYFIDQQTGWAGTDQGIYKTIDGTTWEAEEGTAEWPIRAVRFIDANHGWACGGGNSVLRGEANEDGDIVWTRTNVEGEFGSQVWNDIFFIDQQKGWVVGNGGRVYQSVDGGRSWAVELTGITANLNSLHMVSASKGWIAGDKGVILTYTP